MPLGESIFEEKRYTGAYVSHPPSYFFSRRDEKGLEKGRPMGIASDHETYPLTMGGMFFITKKSGWFVA